MKTWISKIYTYPLLLLSQLILLFSRLYAIYKNTLFFTHAQKKIFSSDPLFKEHEFVQKGALLKKKHQKFLQDLKIRDDLYVIEYPHPMCFSVGSNLHLTTHSHAAIFMSQGLIELDKEAFSFLFKHEISHITYNDIFMRSIICLLCMTFAVFEMSHFMSVTKALFFSFCLLPLIDTALGSLWMRYCEERADRFAMKHSTPPQLEGAVRYFSAIKQYNSSLSSAHPQYRKDGELAHRWDYPLLSTRIASLSIEIQRRTGSLYHPMQEDIDKHVALLKTNNEALQIILAPSPATQTTSI